MAKSGYYTLMASLPALPASFEVPRVPITRPRLERRFGMLEEIDAGILQGMESFLKRRSRLGELSDAQALAAYREAIASIGYPLARSIITYLMEMRLLIAAVRRRLRDMSPPPAEGEWGRHIRRNWQRPGFGLGVRFPWVPRLETLLQEGKVMESHRLVAAVLWDYLRRLSQENLFNFEAVLLYLVRWEVLHGWVTQERARGEERFEELTREAMGEHVRLFD